MEILSFMILLVAYVLVPSLKVCIAVDSIHVSKSLSDGKTLVSQTGKFELGFFSPSNSPNKRYLGIWYKNIEVQTVVWVANRANPINGSSGILTLNSTGNLVLSQHGIVVWHTTSHKLARNPEAELLDIGNLVVRNEPLTNIEDYLWQSFDYPCDTSMPGMKLGRNLKLGLDWKLTSWKSPNDPTPGEFSWGLVLHNYPEYYMMKGEEKFFRVGPWNGKYFSGVPDLQANYVYDFNYVSNKDEISYTYSIKYSSIIFRSVVSQNLTIGYLWKEVEKRWDGFSKFPRDSCDYYGVCGANGNCKVSESPSICKCLNGFSPKSPQAWKSRDWTLGCVRDKPLRCEDKLTDGFVILKDIKVPDTTNTWLDEKMDLVECREKCLNNCSCMAYTNSNITGTGSGCAMWFGDLIDIRDFEKDHGQDLYIRMPASELEPQHGSIKNKTTILATTILAICMILLLCIYFIFRVRRRRNDAEKLRTEDDNETDVDVEDLPLFDLPTIIAATNNFSIENKIGQGGFGPVYKGKLADGQQIAVKRLSKSSRQGTTEFINEVKLIVKLQHRNLVRLLGCCIQGHERLLVYEYMSNGSLDSFIFDPTKGKLLMWPQRFQIIFGIARGLLYLHEDSRLRIIHRDLKAGNVLLDEKLNPKISDFGMARSFGGDQTEGNTNRVVGTYGYMAPEYAFDGLFSIKSDVFSFGILLLEIISGNRNRALFDGNQTHNLVSYTWTLWKEDKALELMDSNIKDSCVASEVMRCIHVSLLCVQQSPDDRPTMTSVLQMLGTEMELVEPKEPSFFPRKASGEESLSSTQIEMSSYDELTITTITGR